MVKGLGKGLGDSGRVDRACPDWSADARVSFRV